MLCVHRAQMHQMRSPMIRKDTCKVSLAFRFCSSYLLLSMHQRVSTHRLPVYPSSRLLQMQLGMFSGLLALCLQHLLLSFPTTISICCHVAYHTPTRSRSACLGVLVSSFRKIATSRRREKKTSRPVSVLFLYYLGDRQQFRWRRRIML